MKIGMVKPYGFKSYNSTTKNDEGAIAFSKPLNADCFQFSTLSFGQNGIEAEYKNKFVKYKKQFTPEAGRLWGHANRIAQKNGDTVLTEEHVFLASLLEIKRFIKDLDNGADINDRPTFMLPAAFEEMTFEDVFSDRIKRAKITPVIDKYIKLTKNNLQQHKGESKLSAHVPSDSGFFSKVRFQSSIKPSQSLMQDVVTMYNGTKPTAGEDSSFSYTDALFFQSLSLSRNLKFGKTARDFSRELLTALMVDEESTKRRDVHLKFYDEKADQLWKNLDLGNDMFILYDGENKTAANHLISSFTNLINKKSTNYKNLNKDNTEIVVLNNDVDFGFINAQVERAKKDKTKTHIFIIPFFESIRNTALGRKLAAIGLESEDCKTIRNKKLKGDGDVRLVFVTSKDIYFNNQNNADLKESIGHYGHISLPLVNAEDAKQMLLQESGKEFILDLTKKHFEDEAIAAAVDYSNSREGYYPEKALKVMQQVASYYIDKDEITSVDIYKYIEETRDVNRTNNIESEFQVSFDTGKTLNDIVGSPMTKAEAQSIVNQIQNKTMTTKGVTVFLDNGTSYGGGRRHTAQAIAGEAQIPMITINARDFALKDIDALAQNAGLSELKIKKLVSLAKSQAEANKNRTAMIFIENFDNFGSDPVYGLSSIYEQKAFSELLREMENVRKNENVNLLIVGSTNRPELLDNDIMKPYKFLDKIIIYSPQDSNNRVDILNYYIDKNGYKIKGETEEEKAAVIKNIAETTSYFTVVDLMYLLEKANSVSKEAGKDEIDRSDFSEAFLQATTGRVSTRHQAEHDKQIIASHECGHALTLQIMHELAQTAEKPWHLPDQVNFITLDPRGDFGGAMFHKNSDNSEYSFERVFAGIVCDFGGHSSEKNFYNMEGSWGISQDMENATMSARMAIEVMGMGPKTGRISIPKNGLGLSDVPERVKNNIYDDIDVFLKNANLVSDKIVKTYAPFVIEFTEKYKDKVGTGECIIPADVFKAELDEWRQKQPEDKKAEFKELEKEILKIIDNTKHGTIAG